jgi:hypothetical protein
MDFKQWLIEEIRTIDDQLQRVKKASPEWIVMSHRIRVLEECYHRYREFRRMQESD